MSSDSPQPAGKAEKKLPLGVVLVTLYQLAKVGFLGYVFLQCLQAQGSGIPPFGEVDAHNPLFESPYFFLFALLAIYYLVVAFGLFALQNWARLCSTLLLVSAVLWWVLRLTGYQALVLPVEFSTVLSALALEVIAVAILYVTPQAREAFAPRKQGPTSGRAGAAH